MFSLVSGLRCEQHAIVADLPKISNSLNVHRSDVVITILESRILHEI